ncbi:MAG: hypothetical protein ACI87O_001597 [Planctomycetota bacterium]
MCHTSDNTLNRKLGYAFKSNCYPWRYPL